MNSSFKGSQFFLQPASSPWSRCPDQHKSCTHRGIVCPCLWGELWDEAEGQGQTPKVSPGSLCISWGQISLAASSHSFFSHSHPHPVPSGLGSTGLCPGMRGGTWILQGTDQAVELLTGVISAHVKPHVTDGWSWKRFVLNSRSSWH